MIMGDNSCSKGRGFESRFRIVVTFGQFSHLIIVKNVLFVKTENKRKIGQGFYLKKIFDLPTLQQYTKLSIFE